MCKMYHPPGGETHRKSSPLETLERRVVVPPKSGWSMPGKPPILAPKNVSKRSKGLVWFLEKEEKD